MTAILSFEERLVQLHEGLKDLWPKESDSIWETTPQSRKECVEARYRHLDRKIEAYDTSGHKWTKVLKIAATVAAIAAYVFSSAMLTLYFNGTLPSWALWTSFFSPLVFGIPAYILNSTAEKRQGRNRATKILRSLGIKTPASEGDMKWIDPRLASDKALKLSFSSDDDHYKLKQKPPPNVDRVDGLVEGSGFVANVWRATYLAELSDHKISKNALLEGWGKKVNTLFGRMKQSIVRTFEGETFRSRLYPPPLFFEPNPLDQQRAEKAKEFAFREEEKREPPAKVRFERCKRRLEQLELKDELLGANSKCQSVQASLDSTPEEDNDLYFKKWRQRLSEKLTGAKEQKSTLEAKQKSIHELESYKDLRKKVDEWKGTETLDEVCNLESKLKKLDEETLVLRKGTKWQRARKEFVRVYLKKAEPFEPSFPVRFKQLNLQEEAIFNRLKKVDKQELLAYRLNKIAPYLIMITCALLFCIRAGPFAHPKVLMSTALGGFILPAPIYQALKWRIERLEKEKTSIKMELHHFVAPKMSRLAAAPADRPNLVRLKQAEARLGLEGTGQTDARWRVKEDKIDLSLPSRIERLYPKQKRWTMEEEGYECIEMTALRHPGPASREARQKELEREAFEASQIEVVAPQLKLLVREEPLPSLELSQEQEIREQLEKAQQGLEETEDPERIKLRTVLKVYLNEELVSKMVGMYRHLVKLKQGKHKLRFSKEEIAQLEKETYAQQREVARWFRMGNVEITDQRDRLRVQKKDLTEGEQQVLLLTRQLAMIVELKMKRELDAIRKLQSGS